MAIDRRAPQKPHVFDPRPRLLPREEAKEAGLRQPLAHRLRGPGLVDSPHRLVGYASREQDRVDGGSRGRGRQLDTDTFAIADL